MSKFDGLIAERQALIDTGVTDPFAIVMDASEVADRGGDQAGKRHDPARHVQLHGHDVRSRRHSGAGQECTRPVSAPAPTAAGCSTAPSATISRSRTGAARILRYDRCDRLFDRVHGKSRYDLDAGRQRRIRHPRRRQSRLDLRRLRAGQCRDRPLSPQQRRGSRQKRLGRLPQECRQSWSCWRASIRCSATSRR